jgi:hypothetical protein
VVQGGDLAAALGGGSAVAEPERQAVEVGGEPEQVDLAAVGLGVAAGGVEFAPEGPGPAERVAGQGGVEPPDRDGGLLQGADTVPWCPFSLRISNGPRLPPHVAY